MDSIRNCPNCNAPIHGNICEYCGTKFDEKGGGDKEKISIYADGKVVSELERYAFVQAQISQAEQIRKITNSIQCPTYNPINYSMENINIGDNNIKNTKIITKQNKYDIEDEDDEHSDPDVAQMTFCISWLLVIFLGLLLWITNKWRIVFDINPILLVFVPCYAIIGMGYAVIFHSSDFGWKHFWNAIDISFTVAFWIGLIWFNALSFKEFGPIILMAYEIWMPIVRLVRLLVG